MPSTLLLCPSPLTRAVVWGRLPEVLAARGVAAEVLDPVGDDVPPFAVRWVAACATQAATLPPGPVVLVGHSGAGPLLPRLGGALHAAGRRVSAYVFLDAMLPRDRPGSRLDLMRDEDPEFTEQLHDHLHGGGRFPEWTDDELAEVVPDPADRAALVSGLRPRGDDFFHETLPAPGDGEPGGWPDAPCGYLRTSEAYVVPARWAGLRGWPVSEHEAGHFAALRDPEGTAEALLALLATLT